MLLSETTSMILVMQAMKILSIEVYNLIQVQGLTSKITVLSGRLQLNQIHSSFSVLASSVSSIPMEAILLMLLRSLWDLVSMTAYNNLISTGRKFSSLQDRQVSLTVRESPINSSLQMIKCWLRVPLSMTLERLV